MKITNLFAALFISVNLCATGNPIYQGTDSLGLPGDNLDLYGVLDLFKKSENPEAFEKALNSPDNKLNNLDLNGDGEIDYIRVIDRTDKDAHAIVLQIPVNEDEAQDVAVIEIEKNADGSTAHVQIVGDEELYGKNYIIQPTEEKNVASLAPERSLKSSQSSQPAASQAQPPASPPVVINVIAWPAVGYIYRPVYNPWISPWRWRYYPTYWHPWKPIYWGMYHPYWYPHHYYHERVYVYGMVHAHDMYYSHRVVSRTVYQRRTAPRSGAGVQRQQRRAPEQRAVQRSHQPRTSAPRSNINGQKAQPRQNRPRSGSGGNGGRGSGGGRRK